MYVQYIYMYNCYQWYQYVFHKYSTLVSKPIPDTIDIGASLIVMSVKISCSLFGRDGNRPTVIRLQRKHFKNKNNCSKN